MSTQPEALRLAAELEDAGKPTFITDAAAAELRRLHEANQELLAALKGVMYWRLENEEWEAAKVAIAKHGSEE